MKTTAQNIHRQPPPEKLAALAPQCDSRQNQAQVSRWLRQQHAADVLQHRRIRISTLLRQKIEAAPSGLPPK
jgi:hypothetical protein